MDNKALEETNAELKKEMTSLKERNHSLEQMLNELLAKGYYLPYLILYCHSFISWIKRIAIKIEWKEKLCSDEHTMRTRPCILGVYFPKCLK